MIDAKKKIGRKIKELRKRAGLTQQQLAEAVDVDAHHISRLENGAYFPSLDTLEKMAKIMNAELQEFFEFPENETADAMRSYLKRLADELPDVTLKQVVRTVRTLLGKA